MDSDVNPGAVSAVPPGLVKAYQAGDYATIQDYTNKASNDYNPIYSNIQNNADKAFFQVINLPDNTPYWMSISGPATQPTGYMWVYTPALPPSNGDGSTAQPVVQYGSYSANSNTLGISNSIWTSSAADWTAGIISTIVMTTVSNFIKNRILGMAVSDAAEEAAAAAGAELAAEGIVTAATWLSVGAFVAGLVVGMVAGAVVFFLIMFIVNFVWKAYKIAVNVYNWDLENSYVITDWYGDNAILDGDQMFSPVILPPPASMYPYPCSKAYRTPFTNNSTPASVKLPNGFEIPTADKIFSYAAIVFDNGAFLQNPRHIKNKCFN